MDNDFSVACAYIAALAAIIAPTVTALIHSFKEYSIAKMNHTIDARLAALHTFSEAYRNCPQGVSGKGTYASNFYKHTTNLIPICAHRTTRRKLFELANEVIQNGTSSYSDKLYKECISLLAKEF